MVKEQEIILKSKLAEGLFAFEFYDFGAFGTVLHKSVFMSADFDFLCMLFLSFSSTTACA